jgi:hypothetical protein
VAAEAAAEPLGAEADAALRPEVTSG